MKNKLISHIFILALLFLPNVIMAAGEIETYQQIPFLSRYGNATDTQTYIKALYDLSIGLAALLAVFKLIEGGVKYMLTDIATSKQDARKGMTAAILGLLIILSAVTILNTINPNLTRLDFLSGAETVTIQSLNSNSTPPATITVSGGGPW